jgi:hypothetical protein
MAALAVFPSAAPAGAATTPSAQTLYNNAMKAIDQEGVHFESIASQGSTTLKVVGDTGVSSGAQSLTVTNGSAVEHIRAMVIGSTGYVQGNFTALNKLIGLKTATAQKYANKWLSFPSGNTELASLVVGLKSSEVASGIKMNGPFKYDKPQTVAGHQAIAVRGTAISQSGSAIPVVLYVSATGSPKPLEQVTNPNASKNSTAIVGTVKFTRWGENSKETAPAHTIDLLKLAPPSSSSGSSSSGSSSSGTPSSGTPSSGTPSSGTSG